MQAEQRSINLFYLGLPWSFHNLFRSELLGYILHPNYYLKVIVMILPSLLKFFDFCTLIGTTEYIVTKKLKYEFYNFMKISTQPAQNNMRSDLFEKDGTVTISSPCMPRTQIVSPATITVREIQAKPFYITPFLLCMKQNRVCAVESNAHHLNNHCI